MPEIISEYPRAVLHKLIAAGGECGEGASREILVDCPPESFCAMPEGELCVYGIDEIPRMITTEREKIVDAVCPPSGLPWSGQAPGFGVWLVTLILVCGIGVWIGRRRGRGSRPLSTGE